MSGCPRKENRSKQEDPIERLRSDYVSELQRTKVDEWLQDEGITFVTQEPDSTRSAKGRTARPRISVDPGIHRLFPTTRWGARPKIGKVGFKRSRVREKSIGSDGHTTNRVLTKDQKKVARVKDLQLFGDYKIKSSTNLPSYEVATLESFPSNNGGKINKISQCD